MREGAGERVREGWSEGKRGRKGGRESEREREQKRKGVMTESADRE